MISKKMMDGALEAEEQFSLDELEQYSESWRSCPTCGGDGQSIGELGHRVHLRCRACGCNFSKAIL
jgi:tRNA(Ile2) C34 agmatinyltransferase TiaS